MNRRRHGTRRRVLARAFVAMAVTALTGVGPLRTGAGAAAWTPASLTGLKLWLDASDAGTLTLSSSNVTQWRDKSGNGFNAAPPSAGDAPTFTAGGVRFLGSQYLLGSMPAGTFASSIQVTAVFKTCSCGLASYQAMPFNRTMNNFPTPFDGYESSLLVGGPTGSYSGWSSFTNLRSDTSLMILSTQMSATKVEQHRNGTLVDTKTGTFPFQDVPNAFHIATRYDRVTQFRGDLYEVVVSTGLSTADRTSLEQYLANKWTVSGVPTTTSTTTTSTTTTSTTTTTTAPPVTTTVPPTTVAASASTAAPALEIVVNAPTTTAPALVAPATAATAPLVVTAASSPATVPRVPTSMTTMPAPTSTLANNAGGTVAPKAPRIQMVAPGSAAVSVGGTAAPVSVQRADNQITVTAGAISATFGRVDRTGAVGALDPDGNVHLLPGDTVRVRLKGFKPGSQVEAWLFSTPVLMGRAKVAADGSVTGVFKVPAGAPSGSHRIAIVARTSDGKPATLTVGVKVGEWKKESSVTVWLIVTPIVAAVVGAMTIPATRRRRRKDAPA